MLRYLLLRLRWMIPTFLGILIITFGVTRLQGTSFSEAVSGGGGGAAAGEGAIGGERKASTVNSRNYESHLDRYRRSGNDLPALVNLRGFFTKEGAVAALRTADPRQGATASRRSRAEKDLWLLGRYGVLPLADVLRDEALAELHAPAAMALTLCAYRSVSRYDSERLPTAELNRINDDNQRLRELRIAYRVDATRGFITEDADAAGKRARLLAFIDADRGRWQVGTASAWSAILWDTGFVDLMGKLCSGRLESETRNDYVFSLIGERWWKTFALTFLSVLIAWGLAIPIGIRAARVANSFEDRASTFALLLLWSLPVMFVGTLLRHLLCVESQGSPAWFPNAGLWSPDAAGWPWWRQVGDWLWHASLPLVCLTYASWTVLSRYMRGALLDQLQADYARTARAKGCDEDRVVYGHCVRNSMITMITLGAGLLAELFGGFVIVETIFSIPGLGLLLLEAAREVDTPLIIGSTVISVALLLIGILLADIAYALVDPRVKARYAA